MTAQQVRGLSHTQKLFLGKDFKSNQKFTIPLSAWQRNAEKRSDNEFGKMLAKITIPILRGGG